MKPALCEYVAGQVLREVEGKEKPLVVLAHVSGIHRLDTPVIISCKV